MSWRQSVVCWSFVAIAGALLGCSDSSSSSGSGDLGGSDLNDAPIDEDSGTGDLGGSDAEDVATDPGSGPEIEQLLTVESLGTVLAFNVEWETSRPAVTDISVDCGEDYRESFTGTDPLTEHAVFVMGLIASSTCQVVVRARDGAGSRTATTTFEVAPLPSEIVVPEVTVHRPVEAQPGWTFFNAFNVPSGAPAQFVAVDAGGRVRWYLIPPSEATGLANDLEVLEDGVLLGATWPARPGASLRRWDGRVVWELERPAHHEIELGDDSRYVFQLNQDHDCANWTDNVEMIDVETSEVVWSWDICDHYTPTPSFNDWAHLNAIEFYPDRRFFLVSSRHQSSIFKVDRETGEIVWSLGWSGRVERGFRGDFEMADEDRFHRQHAPELQPNGNIVLFDNGHETHRPWSRAIEVSLDEENMTAEVVWEYRHDPDIYAAGWGDADRLPNGNTLVTFGLRLQNRNSTITEATPDSGVAWELQLPAGWSTYRSERVDVPQLIRAAE